MKYYRLLAIDPSLTCSGWALFDIKREELIAIGKIKSIDTSHSLSERLLDLQLKIKITYKKLSLTCTDIIVCESQTTMIDPNAAIKVEQVRSMFEVLAREFEVSVPGRINPRTVHHEILGMKGKQLNRICVKESAVYTVEKLFSETLNKMGFKTDIKNLKSNQDIVDAILIGNLAVTKVKSSMLSSECIHKCFDIKNQGASRNQGFRRMKALRSIIFIVTIAISSLVNNTKAENKESKDSKTEETKSVESSETPSTTKTKPKKEFNPDSLIEYTQSLTVCTQNLENLGIYKASRSRTADLNETKYNTKVIALVKRFNDFNCDIIAVQEVVGKDYEEAFQGLKSLGAEITKKNNRRFETVLGTGQDNVSHVGFLIAKDKAELINVISFSKVELPKLNPKQKPRYFLRSPLDIQIKVKPGMMSESIEDQKPKIINLLNIHFKSKRNSKDDPTALEWETTRMEMAEGVRRIVEKTHKKCISSSDQLLLILGDRNSDYDSASAKILEGRLKLDNFKSEGECRLSKNGLPLCKLNSANEPELYSILLNDPDTKLLPGSFIYKKEGFWLDEILMTLPSLKFAWTKYDNAGDYDVGIVSNPPEASDHSMAFVRLKW